jgi:Rps23 Pro-64 3,4-dihydroxylase Tpa1-like proline 4-hydroxylase
MDENFILEIRNSLSKNQCDAIIQKFENDPNKASGICGGIVNNKVKTSIDLHITTLSKKDSEWKCIDDLLSRKLSESVNEYTEHLLKKYSNMRSGLFLDFLRNTHDMGYQIQMTEAGGFFDWHHDFKHETNDVRLITFIWYLNTLEPEQEGCTEFIHGTKIKPEAGKLLLFPATWTNVHRGCVLKSGKKYIITGWLHFPIKYFQP